MLHIHRKLKQLLSQERGQSLVELALLMCFVVVVFLAINWDSFKTIAGNAYLKLAETMGVETSVAEVLDSYTTMSNAELSQVDNAQRIAIDKAILTALGKNLLGWDKSVIETLFATNDYNLLTGQKSNMPYGVILFDYSIDNTGDNGEDLKIKLRRNTGGSVSNKQTIEWMHGNFDTNVSNYQKKNEFVNRRYFYSDDAITPLADVSGDQSVTARIKFSFNKQDKVESVTINLTKNHEVSKNNWETILCEGLSDIVVSN